MSSIWLLLGLLASPPQPTTPSLICCGGEEVFILPTGVDRPAVEHRSWRWRASDSPEIPADAHQWFRTTDECKPFSESILISASSGGVALIRRQDKRCLFYAFARNAHSACVLPRNRIAVASSFGGDELLLFAIEDSMEPATPIARLQLVGAHGVLWEENRKRLWALGRDQLLLVRVEETNGIPELINERAWTLPSSGGHDLSPNRDEQHLFVTTDSNVYVFNKDKGVFFPHAELADHARLKSVDQHPETGEIVYHQAGEENWWSDTIRFTSERQDIHLPDERLYKVRWDVER